VNKTTTTRAFWAGALLLVLTLPAFAAWEESGDGLEAFNSITKTQAKALMARTDKRAMQNSNYESSVSQVIGQAVHRT
jgi:parvulin-like peptidyl-prolyl isomerase